MTKSGFSFWLFMPVVFFAAIFCSDGCCSDIIDNSLADELVIVSTSDIQGNALPLRVCSKDIQYAGGLAKRAELIQLIRTAEAESLLLDNGGLFSSQKFEEKPEGALKDAEVIISVYKKLGYDAFTIGEEDLNCGTEFLERMQKDSALNLVTSNVLLKKNGNRIGKKYVIVQKGNFKIGIISVLELHEPLQVKKSVVDAITVLPPVETVEEIASELEGKVDLIVLLSRLDTNTSTILADANPKIDIVLEKAQTNTGNERMLLVSAGGKAIKHKWGQFIGLTKLELAENGDVVNKKTNMLFVGPSIKENYQVRKLILDHYLKEKREAAERRKNKKMESMRMQIQESLESDHDLSPEEYIKKMMEKQGQR